MFSKTWLSQTAEWVLTAILGGLASAYLTGGIHSWADVGAAVAGGAAVAIVKCLGGSGVGSSQIPSFVEPPAKARPVVVPEPRLPRHRAEGV
jgi:hypothetical protein